MATNGGWILDVDVRKYFDRVQHDVLMSCVARKVRDKRMLKLIGRYLRAGVMVHGLVQPSPEGTMQGGPLSPLLANVLLDDLDKELELRGLRIDKQGRYYNLACAKETFKTRAETIIAVENLITPSPVACRLYLLGPYILILKKPTHISIEENLRGLGIMIERQVKSREDD